MITHPRYDNIWLSVNPTTETWHGMTLQGFSKKTLIFNDHNKDVSYFQIALYRSLKNSSTDKLDKQKHTLLNKLTQTAYADWFVSFRHFMDAVFLLKHVITEHTIPYEVYLNYLFVDIFCLPKLHQNTWSIFIWCNYFYSWRWLKVDRFYVAQWDRS